jgi:archaellin
MSIVITNETTGPVIYSQGTAFTADNHQFHTVSMNGAAVTTMAAQDQIQVNLTLPHVAPKNTKITVELRPAVGAALPFERSIPPTVKNVQVLY